MCGLREDCKDPYSQPAGCIISLNLASRWLQDHAMSAGYTANLYYRLAIWLAAA
jgi:hypothetical protein